MSDKTPMSSRQTSQDGEKLPETRTAPDFSKYNVCDSYCNPVTESKPPGERRLSHRQLEELLNRLSDRDLELLTAIQRFRYLLTGQLQRLHFTDAATPATALRAASRALNKLKALGLIDTLSRRIGGVRAGSSGFVWHITHAGERLIYLHTQALTPTKRFFEPSPYFLAHTLAVAEVAVQLTELCRDTKSLTLSALQPEPECWRTYSEYGTVAALKPDLFAITASGQFEDRWFLEVDLATESPAKIISKCEKYHQYYRSGLEQREAEVFPLTVWIVPTVERKEKLIAQMKSAFDKQPKLFAVITKDELEGLIRYGGERGTLC